MSKYYNQRETKTIKKNYIEEKIPFAMFGIQEWYDAFKALTKNALGLYLYLASNINDYTSTLSYPAFRNALGVSRSSYHRAFKELEDAGYLIRYSKTLWYFYADKNNPNKIQPYILSPEELAEDEDQEELEPEKEVYISHAPTPSSNIKHWDF